MYKIFRIFLLVFLLNATCHYSAFSIGRSLIVGTSADYPPFIFLDNGHIKGFDADLIHKVASALDRDVQFKIMPFDELIPALQEKKIDMAVSAITATPSRTRLVDFSIKYYLPRFSVVYLKAKPIMPKESFYNKAIAVTQGSSMEEFLQAYGKQAQNLKIIPVKATKELFGHLEAGAVDCVLIERAQARLFCSQKTNIDYIDTKSSYDGLNYAIAFPRESSLRSHVDEIILQLKISGELDTMKENWITSTKTQYEKNT